MSNESDYFIKALVSVTSEIDSVNEWSVVGASVWRCVVNGLISRKEFRYDGYCMWINSTFNELKNSV